MAVVHYPGCQSIFPPSDVSIHLCCLWRRGQQHFARTARESSSDELSPRISNAYQRDGRVEGSDTYLLSRIDNGLGSLWAGSHGERKVNGRERL